MASSAKGGLISEGSLLPYGHFHLLYCSSSRLLQRGVVRGSGVAEGVATVCPHVPNADIIFISCSAALLIGLDY